MNVNHKLRLLDQMDDAAFALMMDEYAESEGERLRAEFEADMRAGLTPQKPDGLDDKCRAIIKKEYGKQRRREYAAKISRFTAKAAAAVLITLGITAATILSVEALRVPFINYIIEYRDRYSVLNPQPTEQINDPVEDCISLLVPDGYATIYSVCSDGLYNSGYVNDDGSTIYFDMMPGDAEYRFDTEDAECSTISIRNHEVILVKKEGYQAVWMDEAETVIYSLVANDLSEEEFTSIVDSIIGLFG